jgi:RNA polymerase sigma-70 factor (ECF subfamily)
MPAASEGPPGLELDELERADAAARCAELFAARGGRVRALAQRLLGQDADDGLQEVFAATCRSLPGFRGEARLTTWFHRLSLRVLCAFRRRRDARADREAAADDVAARLSPAALLAYAKSPLDRLVAAERRERVQHALARLSPPLREVLLLRGEGLGHSEIAATLELPLGTVKSRMAAAMVALAERLPAPEELLP